MASESPRVFATGATGYIGGTILNTLLASKDPILTKNPITVLVRGERRIEEFKNTFGNRINPVLYESIDDTDTITSVAAQHDLVINATTGYHPGSAAAAITGLAQRKAATGRPTYYIHTSGVSGLADTPFTQDYVFDDPAREFSDADGENIYQYEKQRDAQTPYLQRTTDIMVFEKGLELGVQTLIIMSPLIYGIGTGLYNRVSIQIPVYIKSAMKHGQSVMVGDGKGEWDYVHVVDLAELYELAAVDMLGNGGEKLPKGEKGVIFSADGRYTWGEVAQGVANALADAGKIKTREVKSVSLKEGAEILSMGEVDEVLTELALTSNSRTKAVLGRERLGWKPIRAAEWKNVFRDDLKQVLEKA